MKYAVSPGDRYGDLCFIGNSDLKVREGRKASLWMCCCGEEFLAATGRVLGGYVKHCGCKKIENMRAAQGTHRMRHTKEYKAWLGIKGRCCVETNKDYPRYGGSGIRLSQEWVKDFVAFYEHIGPCPSPKHQVDRIDNRLGYEPGNVRWATTKEQSINRSNSKRWFVKGLVFESITDAAVHYAVSTQTIGKWCYGYYDKRRGTFTPPRDDCHADLKY